MDIKDKIEKRVFCGWCGEYFTKMFDIRGDNHFRCPLCGNFVKSD